MAGEENHLGHLIAGTPLGGLCGGGMGLGACIFICKDPLVFNGDTILIGAILGGWLGWLLGAGFIEWLKENWWSFW